MTASKAVRKLLGRPIHLLAVGSINRFLPVRKCGFTAVTGTIILEWTTSLDTSSRTLYWNGQLVWIPALGLYL